MSLNVAVPAPPPAEPSRSPSKISAGCERCRRPSSTFPQNDGKQSVYVIYVLQHDLDFKNVCRCHHYGTSETQKEGKFQFPLPFCPFLAFSLGFSGLFAVLFLLFFFLVPVKVDKVFPKQVEFSLTEVERKTCFIAAADKYLTSLWLFLFISKICRLMFIISESQPK